MIKILRHNLPEFILLAACALMMTGNRAPGHLLTGCAAAMLILMLTHNRIMGIGIGIVTGLAGILMFFAVLSEYSEFGTASREALGLLGMGSLLSAALLSLSVILIRKYRKQPIATGTAQ